LSRVTGPLGPFAAGFVGELSRQGFKPETVGRHVALVGGLSSWLAAEGVAVSGLSSEVAERFCAARRAAGHSNRVTIKALNPLLGYLRGLGVASPASTPTPVGPVEELLSSFRGYLEQERGLVPAAARGYVEKVRPWRGSTARTGWSSGAWMSSRCAPSWWRRVRGWGAARRS
jgi:integrase/recombinase XerD